MRRRKQGNNRFTTHGHKWSTVCTKSNHWSPDEHTHWRDRVLPTCLCHTHIPHRRTGTYRQTHPHTYAKIDPQLTGTSEQCQLYKMYPMIHKPHQTKNQKPKTKKKNNYYLQYSVQYIIYIIYMYEHRHNRLKVWFNRNMNENCEARTSSQSMRELRFAVTILSWAWQSSSCCLSSSSSLTSFSVLEEVCF